MAVNRIRVMIFNRFNYYLSADYVSLPLAALSKSLQTEPMGQSRCSSGAQRRRCCAGRVKR
jgi:hypothetical protein